MSCVARWRLKGKHAGKVVIYRDLKDPQPWQVRIRVDYTDKTHSSERIIVREPCSLGDIREMAIRAIKDATNNGKPVADADMQFYVTPKPKQH